MSIVSFNQTHHAADVSNFCFSEQIISEKTTSYIKNTNGIRESPINVMLMTISRYLISKIQAAFIIILVKRQLKKLVMVRRITNVLAKYFKIKVQAQKLRISLKKYFRAKI